MDSKRQKTVAISMDSFAKLSVMSEKKFEISISRAKMTKFLIDREYKKFVVDYTGLKEEELPSITKPKDVTPENISFISDDELRKKIINGQLDDPKLETTLFPKGRPSK